MPDGDVDALAARVIELLRSPELVAADERGRARSASRATGRAEFLGALGRASCGAAIERQAARTRLERAVGQLERLVSAPARSPLGARLTSSPGTAARRARAQPAVASSADAVARAAPGSTSRAARSTALPLDVELGATAASRSRATVPRGPPATTRWLRLRLTWRNSAWETERRALPRAASCASRGSATG